MAESTPATAVQVKAFFEYETAAEFAKDWKALGEAGRNQLKEGIGNGTLTY